MELNTAADSMLLDTELYAIREAARLLQLETITLRRWLDGGTVSKTFYRPVIRLEPTGSDVVTWGEFLEAGILREYRRLRGVSLQKIRPFIDELRRGSLESKYPLAEFQPEVDTEKRELVMRAQEAAQLDESAFFLRRVGPRDHPGGWQVQWAAPVREFIEKIEFDVGIARRLFPLGKAKPVVIDPEVVFGIPQVEGVRTEVIAETFAELGDPKEVAEEWGITPADVDAALQWELILKAA